MNRTFVNMVDDELLAAKHRLLDYARQHPKIAARLRIGNDITSDPHVGRLVQAYALLMARTSSRVEQTFKELIHPLVKGTIRPELDCVPSLAIAELIADPNQPPDPTGARVERGSELEAESPDGTTCRFRTCADVDLWPVYLNNVQIDYPPFTSTSSTVTRASRVIRLSLSSMAGNIPLKEVTLDSLRFYIHAEKDVALRLYESLFCDCLGVWLKSEETDAVVLPAQTLQPAGFSDDESLLNNHTQADGERLVSEFGLLPEKFLFFEVSGLQSHIADLESTSIDLNILLGDVSEEFPSQVDTSTIRLGCVPIINLFESTTEPEEFHAAQSDVPITADSRNPEGTRIHDIREVTLFHEDETTSAPPGFSDLNNSVSEGNTETFWTTLTDQQAVIRFVNYAGEPVTIGTGRLQTTVTCSNGNKPSRLGEEGKFPVLQPMTGAPISEAAFLTRPTMLRRQLPSESVIRRISQSLTQPSRQSLNHEDLADSFRELFAAALKDAPSPVDELARGIADIRVRRVTGTHRRRIMCHGLEISVALDDAGTVPGGIRLFAEMLRRVLAGYVTGSTFVQFQLTTSSGKDYGSWPKITGERFNI